MKVMVASPNNTGINNAYVTNALAYNLYWLGRMGIEVTPPLSYDEHPISAARNKICKEFLEKSDADYLFMYDADTVIPPFGIVTLIRAIKPVISGWYLSRKGSGLPVVLKRLSNRLMCNAKDFNNYQSLTLQEFNSLPSPLTQVDAVGAGCFLISRETLKKLKYPYFLEWHEGMPEDRHKFGEDLWFCERCAEAGVQVVVHKEVFCGHIAWTVLDTRYLIPQPPKDQ